MLRLTRLIATVYLSLVSLPPSAAIGATNLVAFEPIADWRTCEAQGGMWRTDGRGMVLRCYIAQIPEGECLKRGGRWQQFVFEKSAACQVPHPDDRELIECHRLGGDWGKHGAREEHCFYEAKRTDCLTQGGQWVPLGLSQIPGCLLTMHDGGKPCTSSSQCENKCEAVTQPLPLDAPVVGQCSRYNTPF